MYGNKYVTISTSIINQMLTDRRVSSQPSPRQPAAPSRHDGTDGVRLSEYQRRGTRGSAFRYPGFPRRSRAACVSARVALCCETINATLPSHN